MCRSLLFVALLGVSVASQANGFTATLDGNGNKEAPRLYQTKVGEVIYLCAADANQRHRCYSSQMMLEKVPFVSVDFNDAIIEPFTQ